MKALPSALLIAALCLTSCGLFRGSDPAEPGLLVRVRPDPKTCLSDEMPTPLNVVIPTVPPGEMVKFTPRVGVQTIMGYVKPQRTEEAIEVRFFEGLPGDQRFYLGSAIANQSCDTLGIGKGCKGNRAFSFNLPRYVQEDFMPGSQVLAYAVIGDSLQSIGKYTGSRLAQSVVPIPLADKPLAALVLDYDNKVSLLRYDDIGSSTATKNLGPAGKFRAIDATGSGTSETLFFVGIGLDNQIYSALLDRDGNQIEGVKLAVPGKWRSHYSMTNRNDEYLVFSTGMDFQIYSTPFDSEGNPIGETRLIAPGSVRSLQVLPNAAGDLILFGIGEEDRRLYILALDDLGMSSTGYVKFSDGLVKELQVVSPTRLSDAFTLVVRGMDDQLYSARTSGEELTKAESCAPGNAFSLYGDGPFLTFSTGYDQLGFPFTIGLRADHQAYLGKRMEGGKVEFALTTPGAFHYLKAAQDGSAIPVFLGVGLDEGANSLAGSEIYRQSYSDFSADEAWSRSQPDLLAAVSATSAEGPGPGALEGTWEEVDILCGGTPLVDPALRALFSGDNPDATLPPNRVYAEYDGKTLRQIQTLNGCTTTTIVTLGYEPDAYIVTRGLPTTCFPLRCSPSCGANFNGRRKLPFEVSYPDELLVTVDDVPTCPGPQQIKLKKTKN